MKTILGILFVLAGVVGGLYVGVYLMFICGIIQIIEQIRAENLQASIVALGIVKIMFAGLVGYLSGFVLVFTGLAIIED
jgi:hypothetical protein